MPRSHTASRMRHLLLITCALIWRRLSLPCWFCCSAFQVATPTVTQRWSTASQQQRQQHQQQQHQRRRRQRSWSFSSIAIQSRRSCNTNLSGRKENSDHDDDAEKEEQSKRPVNNLDIFGQPKSNKKNTTKKNSFFHSDDNNGEIYGTDKIKSCIPYILPLIDGDTFGKYIYERIPPLGNLDYLLLRPLVESFQAVPLLGIVLFTAFAIGPRFVNLSRDVRFNAQQAVLLDLCLILPTLLGDTIAEADGALHLSRSILEPSSNFVWYANVSMVIYCITWNLRGKRPDGIPFISAAADYAIGPFWFIQNDTTRFRGIE